MNSIFSKIANRLKAYSARYMIWRSTPSLSWWRTLFVNFYFLPFSQAKRLPIYVYGKLRMTKLAGKIEIDCPREKMERGMIRINQLFDAPGAISGDSELILGNGKIVFEGPARIGQNCRLLLWGGGTLRIGCDVSINHSVSISCCNSITIGNKTRISHQNQIDDTNFHFTFDSSLKVFDNNKPIVLGHHCWIGARSSIMKGIELPAYTTVASNSLVNRNVTDKERTLIGGMPAKLLKDSFSRVFNFEYECRIADFFAKNPDAKEYVLTEPLEQYD